MRISAPEVPVDSDESRVRDERAPDVAADGNTAVAEPPPIDIRAAAAIAGDGDALRTLWQENRRWVAAIILAHKPKWADVEDLLQEVAVAFVKKVAEIRDPGALRPWLRTVAVNAAHAAARSGRLRPKPVGLAAEDEAATPVFAGNGSDHIAPPEILGESQRAAKIMELAALIPDGYREPLLLKAIQGLSYREIGRIMKLPETTIETRIARARKQLRELAIAEGFGL